MFFDSLRNAGINPEKRTIADKELFRRKASESKSICKGALEALALHGDTTYYMQDNMNFLTEQIELHKT